MSVILSLPSSRLAERRRWWVLATVAAAQFMLVVDAFIVNVAIPSIRTALDANSAEIEGVIAIYQIALATLLVTGGRLGDIYGRRPVFLYGLLAFTLSSVWCGLAHSGMELVIARLVQGASAALVSPQVLATIHTLFPDAKPRARAFSVFGIALGLGGGVGYVLGGWLIALDLGGLGWRAVFLVNVPVGALIACAATVLMPRIRERSAMQLDLAGATLLFLSLLCLVVPVLAASDLGWPPWLLLVEALGVALMIGFYRFEKATEARGGTPLIDLALLSEPAFRLGLGATALLFSGNLSFYLVVTLYMQGGLGLAPFHAGLVMLPLTGAFILGSRQGAGAVARQGVSALVRGALVMCLGTALCLALILSLGSPQAGLLGVPLALFGYGQGLVMAPLFGVVLVSVRHANAGAGGGILSTTQQIANGVGVALLGAIYFTVRAAYSDRAAVLAALLVVGLCGLATAALLRHMGRAAGPFMPST
jgi:MFS family permease